MPFIALVIVLVLLQLLWTSQDNNNAAERRHEEMLDAQHANDYSPDPEDYPMPDADAHKKSSI
jgi:hypothetical protein